MCITGLGHKTERCHDCLGYGRCGGKPLRQQGRRVSLLTITPIILIHPLIPILRPQRCSAGYSQSDHRCLISPRTCPTPTYNNHLLFSTRPRHKTTCTIRFLLSWDSQISVLLIQRFRLQRCRTRNLIPTSRSCSETGVFLNLVGV